jgi:hypothetical protein
MEGVSFNMHRMYHVLFEMSILHNDGNRI